MYRIDFWTLWEKVRVGCFERTASKHVYYQGWNWSPAQAGCMRQVLGPGALGRPRGIGWRGRWKRGLGRGIHVNPWLINVNVWQKPLQYCKVISLQLIKINGEKKQQVIAGPPKGVLVNPRVVQFFIWGISWLWLRVKLKTNIQVTFNSSLSLFSCCCFHSWYSYWLRKSLRMCNFLSDLIQAQKLDPSSLFIWVMSSVSTSSPKDCGLELCQTVSSAPRICWDNPIEGHWLLKGE